MYTNASSSSSSSASTRLNTPSHISHTNSAFAKQKEMEGPCSEIEPNKKPTLRTKKMRKSNSSPKSLDETWPIRKNKVALEGYVNDDQGSERGTSCCFVGRTKSLTDEDLEELKGCLDLGFGFSYDEIPELCSTLPALELCYSMSQRYSDANSSDQDSVASFSSSTTSPLIADWKISSPGDHPDEVKARLKYWAQAVACTVRLCS